MTSKQQSKRGRLNHKTSPKTSGKKDKSKTAYAGNKSFVLQIPKALGWASPRLRTTLRYHALTVLNNAGSVAANKRYEPTYAYDIDPVVGSTAVPGFAEYGAIYRLYRVHGAKWNVRFSNLETFPLECYACPVNSDPGANYSGTVAQQYLANKLSKSVLLGPLTGNGVGVVSGETSTQLFGGSANAELSDFYSGSVAGSAPQNNWYITIGAVSASAVMVSGFDYRLELDLDIEFYEVSSPSS